MYLQNFLQKKKNEMILKIYKAQRMKPSKGDFIYLVKNDLETIGLINITDEDIKNMSKQRFKKIVRMKVLNAAFSYLKTLQ